MKKSIFGAIEKLVFFLTILTALAAAVLQGPRLLGMTPYVVLSGSMEPVIPAGSVLYCSGPSRQPEPGEIITYRLSSGTGKDLLVTHRILEIRDGRYITKGDSNDQEDPAPIAKEQIIGSYRYYIPLAGYVLARLDRKLLIVILVWILSLNGLSVILSGLTFPENDEGRAEKTKGEQYHEEKYEKDDRSFNGMHPGGGSCSGRHHRLSDGWRNCHQYFYRRKGPA